MDSTPAAAPAPPARTAFAGRVLLLLALALYGLFLARHLGAHAAGSDASGYLNSAKLLARGEAVAAQRVPAGVATAGLDSFTFIPLGYRPIAGDLMAPTYPIGLPLALAAVAGFAGWEVAPPLVMLAAALAAVALMLPLGRAAGLPRGWTIFGALLLAASPLTTFMSLQLMSDVPATAAATAAILGAWRSRERPGWALAAGCIFSAAVLIRPNSLILLVPIGVCLGLDPRRWLLLVLGGLPGAAAQLAYAHAAYGSALASGYGGDLASKFTLGIVPATLAHYARWLPVLLTPVGLLAMALPWLGRRERFAWVLTTWIVVTFAFYAPYFHTHETWWYLRFVLPAFPAALVGGLWVAHRLWSRYSPPSLRAPVAARGLAAAAALAVLGHAAYAHHRSKAHLIGEGESVYPAACAWVRSNLPADAILLVHQTSGAVLYYTAFPLVRWDTLNAASFSRLTAAAGPSGRPFVAMLFPHETLAEIEVRAPGRWAQIGAVRHVTFWQWSPVP